MNRIGPDTINKIAEYLYDHHAANLINAISNRHSIRRYKTRDYVNYAHLDKYRNCIIPRVEVTNRVEEGLYLPSETTHL